MKKIFILMLIIYMFPFALQSTDNDNEIVIPKLTVSHLINTEWGRTEFINDNESFDEVVFKENSKCIIKNHGKRKLRFDDFIGPEEDENFDGVIEEYDYFIYDDYDIRISKNHKIFYDFTYVRSNSLVYNFCLVEKNEHITIFNKTMKSENEYTKTIWHFILIFTILLTAYFIYKLFRYLIIKFSVKK